MIPITPRRRRGQRPAIAIAALLAFLLLPAAAPSQEPPEQTGQVSGEAPDQAVSEASDQAPDPEAAAPPAQGATAPPVEGAAAPPVEAETFFDTVQVTVVNLEVYVTDRKGNRVHGLTRDDFEVFEDRRPVTVTNFFAVEGGRVVSEEPTPPEAEEKTPPLPGRPGAAEPLPEDQQLHLIVYVDNFNIRPFNRKRVFQSLRSFLARELHRGDRVMLVSYDRSLHVRQPFTHDPELIAAQLDELERISAHGIHADSERRDVLEAIEEAEDPSEVMGRLRSHAESVANDLAFTLDALKEFTGSLAGLPGRKAILYLSDGLPMTPAEDLYQAVQQKFSQASVFSDAQSFHQGRRFQELAAQANANRVTFYTIDAAGLRVYSSASAESRTPGFGVLVDSARISNLQSTLQLLAEETGGLAILNTNDPSRGLARVAEDFDTYYSLGYTPAHAGDGRYHRVEVRVEGKGLTARHREGYRDKSPSARMADSTLAALIFGFEQNPMQVDLEIGLGLAREDGLYLVPIQVKIPLDALVLVPQGEHHEGRIRLFVSALDREGGMAPVQETPVPIEIRSDKMGAARGQVYVYQTQLLMRGGDHQVAVGIRDDLGSSTSFVRETVRVGA